MSYPKDIGGWLYTDEDILAAQVAANDPERVQLK